MINSVTVKNHRDEKLTVSLRDSSETGLVLYSITGISPGEANVVITEISSGDGGVYTSARLPSRTIQLGFIIVGRDVEAIRRKLYRYFPLKKKVVLTFATDARVCMIDGYVQANDVAYFSSQTVAAITVMCPSPVFYRGGDDPYDLVTFRSIASALEFPNTGWYINEGGISFSAIDLTTTKQIKYNGDMDTGLIFRIRIAGNISGDIDLYNTTTNQRVTIDSDKVASIMGGEGIMSGDVIEICSERGSKSIKLYRGGVYYNILGAAGKECDWLRIEAGYNDLYYTCDAPENLSVEVAYKTLYEGL